MKALGRVLGAVLDPDRALMVAMNGLVEAAAIRYAVHGAKEVWRPGKPLKLFLAGYTGTRNTGADVRVEEMVRQFRALVGDARLELSIGTFSRELSAGYFRAVRQVGLPTVFPQALFEECPSHHGVVACEGSMFKSKFSNALSTFMAGALGMASAEGKLGVGYGAEAGEMDPHLRRVVEHQVRDALIICRNEPSRQVLGELGIRTSSGADTAWTFDPGPLERGARLLQAAGWDGKRKIVAVCPINPFWWPVKPDVLRAAAHQLAGQHHRDHYKSIYFHHHSSETDRKNEVYLDGLARALAAFVRDSGHFPILVGMEQLDRRACEALAERLPFEPPCFVSDQYDMYELVSILRNCSLLLSSRYHAIVCSMPAGVPSAGITMDERIENLLVDRGDQDLLLWVDDEALADRTLAVLRRLDKEAEAIRERINRYVPTQLALMGEMGRTFLDEIERVYPELPRKDRPRGWEHHLPEISPSLTAILERWA